MAEPKLPQEGQNNNPQGKSKETWKSLGSVVPFKPKKTTQSKETKIPVRRHLQIVKLAGNLAEQTREEAGALGFMSRLLIMVNLPYRDPGKEARSWWRKNGKISIVVTPACDKEGKSLGIPYGTYPRLILVYLITQAVKTQNPNINLGNDFKDFIEKIGLEKGGHQFKNVKKQLERILSSSFSWIYEANNFQSRTNVQVSRHSYLWWNPLDLEQKISWKSHIILNTDFFNEIKHNTVPLDLRVLGTLKNSPLGFDLYMFIIWRTYKLEKYVYMSWESLQEQLGGQYSNAYDFSKKCRFHIKRIKALCPHLDITFLKGRLCLGPLRH